MTSSSQVSDSGSSSGDFVPTDDMPIHLTPEAVKAIKRAIEEEGESGDGLRVSVVGGGCSGYQYNLDFEKESRIGDVVIPCDGVSVFIDSVSAGYLRGTVIDYVSGLQGTGFKFSNPNAKRTCGCGHSFS
ncbi:MAG: iron-sulfur cluster assembly accessory protein [Bdellovibrionota bacterium]|nr:MAG: iron-sulfur cluster assembly accessory protein [Bdellovibrionota bacterium]